MGKRYENYDETFTDLLSMRYTPEVYAQYIRPLEREGRTEKSICFAIWKSSAKLLRFRGDSRFWGIFRNEITKWSWATDDPRWEEWHKRKAEREHAAFLTKQLQAQKKAERDIYHRKATIPMGSVNVSPKAGCVYFIQGENGGAIKIGHTHDLEARLQALQTGYPDTLTVLLAIPGTKNRESAVHQRLEQYRLRGEWFKDTPEVREKMEEFKQKYLKQA